MDMAMHRYSYQQFSKTALRQRRSKLVALLTLLLALGVLFIYLLQNQGFLR
jgi:hypothetical protein